MRLFRGIAVRKSKHWHRNNKRETRDKIDGDKTENNDEKEWLEIIRVNIEKEKRRQKRRKMCQANRKKPRTDKNEPTTVSLKKKVLQMLQEK